MATSLREVYDLFTQLVTDYRLTDLFETSEDDFDTYLEAWLIYAITDFSMCDQSLDYDATSKEFTVTLTARNKVILARLMAKYWLKRLVNDITQMNLHITDRDFRMASEAQNLKQKREYLILVEEELSQLINNYQYSNVEWDEWYNQNFSGE
jgi:hypothetical protein